MRAFRFLYLLLTFSLGLAVSAQSGSDDVARVTTNIAFIKNPFGLIIDSITVSATLESKVVGFDFSGDTLLLDVDIFSPVDELRLETFGGGQSFGPMRCWVDAPSANVYLSVVAGRGEIDSVGLSPMDTWFREEVRILRNIPMPILQESRIFEVTLRMRDNLMSASMLSKYLDLPTIAPPNSAALLKELSAQPAHLKEHPRMQPLLERLEVVARRRPLQTWKMHFLDPAGTATEIPIARGSKFTVLNYHQSSDRQAQEDHARIKELLRRNTIFHGVNLVSITTEASTAFWQLYVRDNRFPWRHYQEVAGPKGHQSDRLYLFPSGPTYVLLNASYQVVAIYPALALLTEGIDWRRNATKWQRSFRYRSQ